MNSLSWIIYLADVAGGVKSTVFGVTLFASIGYGAYLLAGNYEWFINGADDGIFVRLAGSWRKALWIAALPFVASLIPSSGTVYAIAASEMGERALNTPTAGKAVKALNAWLDRQIDGNGKPDA